MNLLPNIVKYVLVYFDHLVNCRGHKGPSSIARGILVTRAMGRCSEETLMTPVAITWNDHWKGHHSHASTANTLLLFLCICRNILFYDIYYPFNLSIFTYGSILVFWKGHFDGVFLVIIWCFWSAWSRASLTRGLLFSGFVDENV